MLKERVRLARDEYRMQLQKMLARTSEAEQEYTAAQEAMFSSTVKLTDALVGCGEVMLNTLKSADAVDSFESEARSTVTELAQHVAGFLEQAVDADSDYWTRKYCEQAKKVADVLSDLQRAWPWTDLAAIEKAHGQYERGELMDFETFKHELLGPEE